MGVDHGLHGGWVGAAADLAGLRIALEPQAARLAARARDRSGIAAIGHAYLRMTETIDDPDAFIGRTLPAHKAVLDAITARDADLAEELMRKLVTGAQHDIRRDLTQRHQQAS